MHQEFVILTVETDLLNKKIVVTTNNDIDPNSIDEVISEIYTREDRTTIEATKEINKNQIIFTLVEWPIPNSSYIFYLKTLKNILGESLRSGVRRRIEFKSDIVKEVTVISPAMHEEVKSLNAEFKVIQKIEVEEEIPSCIYVEVSTDNAFYNVVKSTTLFDNKTNVTISGLKAGQHFIRARIQSTDEDNFQYGKWSDTVSFIFDKQLCTPEAQEDVNYIPEYEDMTPIVELHGDFNIITSIVQGETPTSITITANVNFNEKSFDLSQIIISGKEGIIEHEATCSLNEIKIDLIDELKDNTYYILKIIGIESIFGEVLSEEIKFRTRMRPMYCEVEAVTSLIGDYKIPEDVILYHIREASRFADYILGRPVDEDDVPFNVSQFVKYYAAHECLVRHIVQMAESNGLRGVVGNVQFEERDTSKDVTALLKHFCAEIDKWKDDLKGYPLEGRAKMQTTVRGIKASPVYQKTPFNYGRRDFNGQ